MNEISNNGTERMPNLPDELETRIFRSMIYAVSLAVIIATFLAPWRVTTGLILGGLLSLLNYRWLHGTVAAVLDVQEVGKRPQVKPLRYVLRYFVIAATLFVSYKLRLASLPAAIAGLCSFVAALFVEAFRQFYFAIIRREESF